MPQNKNSNRTKKARDTLRCAADAAETSRQRTRRLRPRQGTTRRARRRTPQRHQPPVIRVTPRPQ
eukprot:3998341-Prymnesium_polylepis.1